VEKKTTESPDISIIIVNMNTEDWLKKCLKSIAKTKGDVSVEVIVVDNGSTDESEAVARSIFPDVIWLPQGENIGYVKANNVGMKAATGRFLMYLNNDTIMAPGCLHELIAFLDRTPEASGASPRICNPDGTDQGVARSFPTIMNGLFGRRSALTRLFPDNRWSRRFMTGRHYEGDEPLECDVLSAACLVVRTDLAKELGGFDEDFTLYWVDSELLGRMRRRGYKSYMLPRARITHFEGSGGSTSSFRQRCRMTIAFNRDSYLCYIKVLQLGPLDPRRLLAAGMLSARALLLMGAQLLRPGRATSSGGKN